MKFDLPMSAKFRHNTTELTVIRLALNELVFRYEHDKDSKLLVHQAIAIREKMYPTARHLYDIERNMIRSNWGGSPIYTIMSKEK